MPIMRITGELHRIHVLIKAFCTRQQYRPKGFIEKSVHRHLHFNREQYVYEGAKNGPHTRNSSHEKIYSHQACGHQTTHTIKLIAPFILIHSN